jgi:TaqI-like C-terminal specificity domain/Eco57I restriction-modification methylase
MSNRQPAARRKEFQVSLPGFCPVEAAISSLAASGREERGAIFTRREVVEFILDLVGYTRSANLVKARLLEPSFGAGDFLIPAVERLIASIKIRTPEILANCIRAVELHPESFERTRNDLKTLLEGSGVTAKDSSKLLDSWLIRGDFLLAEFERQFTHVIGNPPYVRQELIPDALMQEYRKRFSTIYDRADLYVPFIERSLELLDTNGAVGFICADRWMKNRYGGPLRKLVSDRFHLKYFVDMVDTPAFHSEVIAYPAIIVITNEVPTVTRVARRPDVTTKVLTSLAKTMRAGGSKMNGLVQEISSVANGSEPWVLEAFDKLAVMRRIEREFPKVEDVGCKVGIGVATGADQVFIGKFDELDVEPSRKLPLVMTRDILEGTVEWRGFGVINPFEIDGKLALLARYPKLARYLETHGEAIRNRHVSTKNPGSWYRTIDRIYPELAKRPKLLIPDIKGEAHIVYEEGRLYPHHNLYWMTADEWDLRALQAVLLSDITKLFIGVYSTKMRGGYFRYQAQYLRRICIPKWSDVSPALRKRLVQAAKSRDFGACNDASFELYRLTESERAALRD